MEIEKRARLSNKNEFENKIKSIGAKFVSKKQQNDIYYGSIELYKKLGHSFITRIRESNNTFELAVKSAKLNTDGVWEEYETIINDPIIFTQMFQAMGFEKIIELKKERLSYKLDNFTINIDSFIGVGDFVEIELISEKADSAPVFELMQKAGIKKNEIINKGYISLLLKENKSKFAKYVKN